MFEAGLLGGGSWFVFCKVIPYFSRHETLHELTDEEKQKMRKFLFGIFQKAKRWPDHVWRFMASYTMKGTAFILLFGVLAILLTDIGWLDAFKKYHDLQSILLFARSGGNPNGAHLIDYIPIPLLGLYVAWKYRTGDGMPNSYLGLLICALGVAIHETLWTAEYYFFYWQYLSWGVLDNVIKDVFFFVMLFTFIYVYVEYPFQKIPLKTYLLAIYSYLILLILWGIEGFTISTVNNFEYGQGIYMITRWWADPLTNALEVGSWILLYGLMWVSIWRLKR